MGTDPARHRRPPGRATWGAVIGVVMTLAATLLGVTASPASASADQPAAHQSTGRVVNTLVAGDSYVAGNGSSGTRYMASADDPGAPSDYSGSGCRRTYNNGSHNAYQLLGSTGWYINRACSGKLTSDVLPEVENLIGTPYAAQTDLIVYSAGGNDAAFADIVTHCLAWPDKDKVKTLAGGRQISENCYNLLGYLKGMVPMIIERNRANVINLLTRFPNAKLVLDGYPMLVGKVNPPDRYDQHTNTVRYAYDELAVIMPDVAKRQAQLVKEMAAQYGGRIVFNDLFTKFGGVANNHGMYSSQPWIYGPRYTTNIMDTGHPNPTGQTKIGQLIRDLVNGAGWFANYPSAKGKAPINLYHLPLTLASPQGYLLVDSRMRSYYAPSDNAPGVVSCANNYVQGTGWIGNTGIVHVGVAGPDKILIVCRYPRNGDILHASGARSFIVESGGGSKAYVKGLRHIPTAWMYNCKAGKAGVTHYLLRDAEVKSLGTIPVQRGEAGCVPSTWRNHVVSAPNGASYFVDASGVKHHIMSTQTFAALVARYGAAIRVTVQVDVDTIPTGTNQPEEFSVATNSIVRRTDGVSWVIDGNRVRHHIPNARTDVCVRFVQGLKVSQTGLSAAQAASLPEGAAWSCNADGVILASNEGASYVVQGTSIRWIQDVESYYAYAEGRRVIRGISMAEVRTFTEGSWMPLALSASRVKNHVVREAVYGTSYFVDSAGLWHWIKDGGTYNCLVARYGAPIQAKNMAQINTLRREGPWALCA